MLLVGCIALQEFGSHATMSDITNSVTQQLGMHAFADHFSVVLQSFSRKTGRPGVGRGTFVRINQRQISMCLKFKPQYIPALL